MIITYQGDNYFKFQSGNTTILTDPTDQRSFRGADIILNSQYPAPVESKISNGIKKPSPESRVFWIDHAGEYEIGGVRIQGWQSTSLNSESSTKSNLSDIERTIYRLDFDDFRIALFGFLEGVPKDEFQEYLTDIDIVIAPASNGDFMKVSDIVKFIRQLEPALIILPFTKNFKNLLKEFNKEKCEKEEKIVLRKNDLPESEMEIRCLKSI